MTCTCDQRIWPPTLAIVAGLDDLPRQLVTFADLKSEMLARARFQPALAAWRGRAQDDYGVMLLELWAYVGEMLSIYDKAIADESYVRTAKLRSSLRRLVASLGYLPRPAVGATARVALLADGTQPLLVPVGTAFRSGAFGAEPPQVFELTKATSIHPALDQWDMATPVETTLTGQVSELLVDPATLKLAIGDTVLVELTSAAASTYVRKVDKIDRLIDGAGRRVAKVTLDQSVDAGTGVSVAGIVLRKASRKAALKSPSAVDGEIASYFVIGPIVLLVLDSVHRDLHLHDRFLLELGGEQRWATTTYRTDVDLTYMSGSGGPTTTTTITDASNTVTAKVVAPSTSIRSTYTIIVTTDPIDDPSRRASPSSPAWKTSTDITGFTVRYGLVNAGRVLGSPKRTLSATDPLRALGTRAPINSVAQTSAILLRDVENSAVAIDAGIALDTGVITLGGGVTWSPPLAAAVTGFGNVVTIGRGETVPFEVIGDGDSSQLNQVFQLKKKPLTYTLAPGSDSGVASTLQVWVEGVLWTEVPTLYGQDRAAQVYTVRQTDDGESLVKFGDGIRGARVPTGVGNVVASYRYGAGAAAPPAGSISQLAKPVSGLKSVIGAPAAGGGADPEPAASLATLAPRSALLLGRAISIEDMEVAALSVPGVIAARTDWAWDGVRQRAVVKVWVVGDATSPVNVTARLLALSEPNTPINVEAAVPVTVSLHVDLEIDPRRIAADVIAAAATALTGWLSVPALGIDQPLFRSHVVERVTSVDGVIGIRGMTWNGLPWFQYGKSPGNGAYFDFSGLSVTGS